MGEVSRFLANVFSLGAVKKVDDAMDGYRSVVRKYNDYVDQSTKLEDEIDILEKNINKYTKFYDFNKKIVLEILKNEEACKKLATGELDDLKSFLNNSLVVSSRLSTNLYFDDIFFSDDSVGADFATCATCACIPVFGSIGLRMIANDDIERIYSEKRKIVGNIDKLKEHIESLVTCKCKLEKKLNVQKNIRKIIMNYIKNNILLLQKKISKSEEIICANKKIALRVLKDKFRSNKKIAEYLDVLQSKYKGNLEHLFGSSLNDLDYSINYKGNLEEVLLKYQEIQEMITQYKKEYSGIRGVLKKIFRRKK